MMLLNRLPAWIGVGDWRLHGALWVALAVLGYVYGGWLWLSLGAAVSVGSVSWALYQRYPMHDNWMPAWMRMGVVGLVVLAIASIGVGLVPKSAPAPALGDPEGVEKERQQSTPLESEAERQKRINVALYQEAVAGAKAGNGVTTLDPATRTAIEALPIEALTPPKQNVPEAPVVGPQSNKIPTLSDLGGVVEKDPKGLAGWLEKLCKSSNPAQGVVLSPSCGALGLMLTSMGISLGAGKDMHTQVEAIRMAQNGNYDPLIRVLGKRSAGREDRIAVLLDRLHTQLGVDKAALTRAVRSMSTDQWCVFLAAAPPTGRDDWQTWAKAEGVQQKALCR